MTSFVPEVFVFVIKLEGDYLIGKKNEIKETEMLGGNIYVNSYYKCIFKNEEKYILYVRRNINCVHMP